jgi:hypothetical protein
MLSSGKNICNLSNLVQQVEPEIIKSNCRFSQKKSCICKDFGLKKYWFDLKD